MDGIVIRQITDADVLAFRAVVDFVAREKKYLSFVEAPDLSSTQAYVLDNVKQGHTHLLALDGEKVVGWCDVVPETFHTANLHCAKLGIGLLPPYRGKGLGRRLMEQAIADAFARSTTRIELTVVADNANAIALYEKLGFVREGRHRNASRIDGAYSDIYSMALLKA